MFARSLLAVLVLSLTGCATTVVDAPANAPDPVVLPELEPSRFQVPVSVEFEGVRQQILARVPKPLAQGAETQIVQVRLNQAAAASRPATAAPACTDNSLACLGQKAGSLASNLAANVGPITLTAPVETRITYQALLQDVQMRMQGEQFAVTATVDFSVGSRLTTSSALSGVGLASCGINEPMPRIEFTLPGTLKQKPDGSFVVQKGNWTLRWLRPCNITAFNLNIESLINLPGISSKVNQAITDALGTMPAEIRPSELLAKVWPMINEPREVQPGVWLSLQPERVGLGPITGQGKGLTTRFLIQARPQVTTAKPDRPFPPVPAVEALGQDTADGFHLALRGDLGLEQANALMNQQLAGKPFQAGGREVLIDKIRLYGNGARAVIGVTLSKPVVGEIYLLAKPVFDIEQNEVRFEDIDFSLATSNWLLKSASWMLSGTFRSQVAEKAKVRFDQDFADQLAAFKDKDIDIGDGLKVRLNIERISPRGLFFTPEDIKVFLAVDGKVAVSLASAAVAAKPQPAPAAAIR